MIRKNSDKNNKFKWIYKPLKDLIDLYDSGIWGSNPSDNPVPVLRSNNIQEFKFIYDEEIAYREIPRNKIEKYRLKFGDIIVVKSSGSKSHIGKCAIYEKNDDSIFLFSNFTLRIRANSQIILPHFLYYYLISSKARFDLDKASATSSGLLNIQPKVYAEQILPVPPLVVQKQIVQILQKADEIRQKQLKALIINNSILPAIFFDTFDNRTAKWPEKPLRDIVFTQSGGTPSRKRDDFWNGDIPWISPTDMKSIELSDSIEHITEQGLSDSAASLVSPSAILVVVRSGILEHTFPVAIARTSLTFNQDIKALIPKPEIIPEFLLWALKAKSPHVLQSVVKRGSTVHSIDSSRLFDMKIPVPPLTVQKTFVNQVEQLMTTMQKLESFTIDGEALFNSLMKQAFSGELTREWEKVNAKWIKEQMKS